MRLITSGSEYLLANVSTHFNHFRYAKTPVAMIQVNSRKLTTKFIIYQISFMSVARVLIML